MTSTMNTSHPESQAIDSLIASDTSSALRLDSRRGRLPFSSPMRVITAIVAVGLVALLVAIIKTGVEEEVAIRPVTAAAVRLPATLDERIRTLDEAVRENPNDASSWSALASAHIRRVYETGDPSSYAAAQQATTKTRELSRDAPESLLLAANLALSQHRFTEAFDLATRVQIEQPNRAAVLIPLIDATVETGRYREAAELIDQLMDLRPSVAARSRRSYLRQLNGDVEGAVADMRQAVQAAPTGSIDQAVALGYLGDVELERGDQKSAQRAYDRALAIQPRLPQALLGRATLDVAQGDILAATNRLEKLIEVTPIPGAIAMRAEIARKQGDNEAIAMYDELLDATVKLYQAGGSVLDSEFALALADRSDPSAVDVAQRAYAERHTIFTADALAWALYRSGRAAEAQPYAKEAVATKPLSGAVHAHAALVFAKVGDIERARESLVLARRNSGLMFPLPSLLAAIAPKINNAPEIAEPSK
jgi:tetratricopeptide (TPR) repeat protein